MEDYYEYLDSNGVTTLYKLIKDDTVALIDSYSITINGITTTLDNHVNNADIHTPISTIEGMINTAVGSLNYATPDYVDTKVAGLVNSAPETLDTLKELSDALGNDPNFATTVANQIGTKADKDSVYTKQETDTLLEGKANSEHSHVVSDITDFPTIPTKVSELTNDSGYITSVSWNDVTSKPVLSQVAISGSYSDLSGTPTIPTKTSQLINDSGFLTSSNGLITSVSWSDITNKPNFSKVATSGSYNDLSNKPTIPNVYNKTLTIQKNGTNVATFTSNSNTDVTADITVPTKVSELSNDSGFITGISWDKVTNKPTLATVATSGSYTDLSNTPTIPTKVSQLENDMGFGTGGDTSDCVHKTGNETISGIKTFSDITISNKELHYKDTKYDWTDTSLNVWCNAGHVAWFDKTGNRRMHELVGAKGGVWRKACYINENQYFSVDSNRNITYWGTTAFNGTVSLNGNVFAYYHFFQKNNNMDITTNPSKTLYTDYTFKDKNNETLSYIQYARNPNGIHNLGLFIRDSEDKLYGVVVNSAKEFYPFGDNTYSLGKSDRKWANVYSTNTITNEVITYSVKNHNDTSSMTVSGGSSWDKGSTLFLYGNSHSNHPGAFNLTAKNTTNTSQLIGFPNGTLTWGGKSLAIDENLVHRSGNETIAGFKSFTEVLDRRNDVTISTVATATQLVDTNANRCGWIANRMHWSGNYHVHNRHIAYNENSGKEVYIDIISSNNGSGGLFVSGTATNRNLYDITSAIDHTVLATMGWVNNPATSTNVVHRSGDETISGVKTFSNKIKGNLQGNADTATKASYLDNYSLPGGNKIYLDWDRQVKDYVGLKVDNTNMGGLITTKSIGSQSVNYATNATQASYSNQLQAFTGDDFTGGNHFVKAIRSTSGWSTRLWMCYNGGTKTSNEISVAYADSATYATTQATSDNSTKIATTAWVRTYVNSVVGSGSIGASISAYYSNATTQTAEGNYSSSGNNYPSDYSNYINIAPTVGTIYTGSQLFSSLTPTASGTINKQSTGPSTKLYHTTAKATANFSGAFSSSARYLCTTANAVKFRAYVSQGSDSSMGSPSVVDNSSAKSIFIRVQ